MISGPDLSHTKVWCSVLAKFARQWLTLTCKRSTFTILHSLDCRISLLISNTKCTRVDRSGPGSEINDTSCRQSVSTMMGSWLCCRAVHTMFGAQSRANVRHLRCQLQSTWKEVMFATQYMHKMKIIADTIATTEAPVSSHWNLVFLNVHKCRLLTHSVSLVIGVILSVFLACQIAPFVLNTLSYP
jgi:hypothetical protein